MGIALSLLLSAAALVVLLQLCLLQFLFPKSFFAEALNLGQRLGGQAKEEAASPTKGNRASGDWTTAARQGKLTLRRRPSARVGGGRPTPAGAAAAPRPERAGVSGAIAGAQGGDRGRRRGRGAPVPSEGALPLT